MTKSQTQCLILACGNPLRGDDGVGPWLAAWAEEQFRTRSDVRVLSRQQWTPELAEDVSRAETVLFIDCAVDLEPGTVRVHSVEAAIGNEAVATHHLGPADLLALGRQLYNSLPRRALLLTVGAGSLEVGETFCEAVQGALPEARRHVLEAVSTLLSKSDID